MENQNENDLEEKYPGILDYMLQNMQPFIDYFDRVKDNVTRLNMFIHDHPKLLDFIKNQKIINKKNTEDFIYLSEKIDSTENSEDKKVFLKQLSKSLSQLERLMLDIDNRINECEYNISILASEILNNETNKN